MLVCVGHSINGCFVFGSRPLAASELWKLQHSGSLTSWLLGALCQREALEGDRKAGGGGERTPLCFPVPANETTAAAGSGLNPCPETHSPRSATSPPTRQQQQEGRVPLLCGYGPLSTLLRPRGCALWSAEALHVSPPPRSSKHQPREPPAPGPGSPASSLCSPSPQVAPHSVVINLLVSFTSAFWTVRFLPPVRTKSPLLKHLLSWLYHASFW